MPLKHGKSHSLGFLVSAILGIVLEEFIKPFVPMVYEYIGKGTKYLAINANVIVSERLIIILFIGFLISLFWGIEFGIREQKTKK